MIKLEKSVGLGDAIQDRLTEVVEDVISRTAPPVLERYIERLGLTEETLGQLAFLATKSGDSREIVLKKALTLYGLALDAAEKGNKISILSPDDEVIQDIVGFEPLADDPQRIDSGTGS